MADFHELVTLCRNKTVYIQTHNFPDPDAIGSAFGLQRLLERFDIHAEICYDGHIDKLSASKMLDAFGITMHASDEIADRLRDEDYIICVDSQKNAGNITDFTGEEVASIDHHPTFVKVEYRYEDIQLVGACATLIAEYYRDMGVAPDSDAATALLYGIKMDTLEFTRGVTERDIQAFSFLHPLIDQDKMTTMERNNMEFKDLQAYGAAIENIRLYGYVGISGIPFPCPDAMIAILSDFILSLVEVEVAVIYCERENGMKFSVRSERGDVHAGELIHQALEGIGDGGGHAAMAGGLIPRENIERLGHYPHEAVRERIMTALGRT